MTDHESHDSDGSTDDLLSGTGEGDGSTFAAISTATAVASLENPAIADAIAATDGTADPAKPKRRGRRTNAEIAADKAKAAEGNWNRENPVDHSKPIQFMQPKPFASPLSLIDSAVTAFASDPAQQDLTYIIAAIAEWTPAVAYRGIFRAIAQTHGEVGIYHALTVICPRIRREKRSGMAVAASMSAVSARSMGKGIDQGEVSDANLMMLIGTQVLANRYAGLGSAEVAEIMREPN